MCLAWLHAGSLVGTKLNIATPPRPQGDDMLTWSRDCKQPPNKFDDSYLMLHHNHIKNPIHKPKRSRLHALALALQPPPPPEQAAAHERLHQRTLWAIDQVHTQRAWTGSGCFPSVPPASSTRRVHGRPSTACHATDPT